MINKVFLIGRLGKDVTVKRFENGGAIAEFTVATDDSYKNKNGEKVEQTDWHTCKVVFPKLVEIAEKFLKKGSLVHIEGKLKTRSYDDKDGNKRYVTEVVCESFKMLDKREGNATSEETPAYSGGNNNSSVPEDDLPF